MLNLFRPKQAKPTPEPAPVAAVSIPPRAAQGRAALLSCLAREDWSIRDTAHAALMAAASQEQLALWQVDSDDYEGEPRYEIRPDGIAVVRMCGVLLDVEHDWWLAYLECCSIPALGRLIAEAYADQRAPNGVALYADSPGGHAAVSAVADLVWSLRQDGGKPVRCIAKDICSAAYHIGSQCQSVTLAQDGTAGCIGTLIVTTDWSRFYADMGIVFDRTTSSGAETYKGAGAHGTELTPEQKADLKRVCDEAQAPFTANVARGRGFTAETAQTLADGRYHLGTNAVALGLVDNIMGKDEALALMASGEEWPTPGPPTTTPNPDFNPVRDERGRFAPASSLPSDDDSDPDPSRKKGNDPMDLWEHLKAALSGVPAPEATTNPKAGGNSPGLSAAEREELDRLRAGAKANAEAEKSAVDASRKAAKAAAVTAFADRPDTLLAANKALDAIDDRETLDALTQTYTAAKPAALQSRGRITTAQNPLATTSVQPAGDVPDENDALTDHMVSIAKGIAARRTPGGK